MRQRGVEDLAALRGLSTRANRTDSSHRMGATGGQIFLAACVMLIMPGVQAMRTRRASRVVPTTTILIEPYLERNTEGGYTGYIQDLVSLLEERLGDVTFELTEVHDGHYGKIRDNQTWSGMIGELVDGRAEVAAAPLTVSDERAEVVDFTDAFMEFPLVLLMKRGHEEGLHTVSDLLNRHDLQYGARKDGSTEFLFKNPGDTQINQMWEVMKRGENRASSTMSGIDRVRKSDGKYAMILEKYTAEYHAIKQPCDLVTVDLGFGFQKKYALATSKGSSLLERLNRELNALKSSGEMERLRKKYWVDDAECSAGPHPDAHAAVLMAAMMLAAWLKVQ